MSNTKEIANYRKWDTDLSVNIWLMDSNRYLNKKHIKELRFQIDYDSKVKKTNFATISLIDNKVINADKILKKHNCKVCKQTFTAVENFCTNNNFALTSILESIISESDFFSVIIKGKDLKTDEEIKEAKLKTKDIIKKGLSKKRYDDDEELLNLAKKAIQN